MPKYKSGVVWVDMHPKVVWAVGQIDNLHMEEYGELCTITSGREGEHSKNSYHYEGRAADVRSRHISATSRLLFRTKIQEALGEGFDVITEKTHFHIEWDLKKEAARR